MIDMETNEVLKIFESISAAAQYMNFRTTLVYVKVIDLMLEDIYGGMLMK